MFLHVGAMMMLAVLELTCVTSYLMCHVCGCPDSQGRNTIREKCSGNCKDQSDLGKELPCPSGACHSLTVESEIEEQNNITFHRNCFDKDPTKYLKERDRSMNECTTLSMLSVVTTECLCDKSFCNFSSGVNINNMLLLLLVGVLSRI